MAPAVEGSGGSVKVLGSDVLGPKGGRAGAGERGLESKGTRVLRGSIAGRAGPRAAQGRKTGSVAERCRSCGGGEASLPSGSMLAGGSGLCARSMSASTVLAQAGASRGAGLGAAGLPGFLRGGCFLILVLLLLSPLSSSSSSGCSWDPASGSTAAGRFPALERLASKSQAGGRKLPGPSHWTGAGSRMTASTQKRCPFSG